MAVGGDKNEVRARKERYFERVAALCAAYPSVLIVTADNIGSSHMQKIRQELRGLGVTLLMGKNTQIRRAIRNNMAKFPKFEGLLPLIAGNVGLVFCKANADLGKVRERIHANKVGAPAKAGAIAPCDVVVPAGPTGMEPTMTSFLQALNISSKIVKGQVEIIADVKLLNTGDKVSASAASLLQRLKITPFAYALKVINVFDDGHIYSPALLDISDNDILSAFGKATNAVAAVSLETGVPTVAAVAKLVVKALASCIAVSVETDYTFKKSEDVKKYLADPSAFKSAAPAPAAAAAAPAAGKPAAKEEKVEAVEEDFGGGGLFGGGSDY